MTKPRIALILGSDRPTRFADKPAAWLKAEADKRGDLVAEIVDPRDFGLPFFTDPASNAWMESPNEKVRAWQDRIGGFDGYVFLTPEYNHSIPAVLKNALDQAYKGWMRKPMAVFGYGALGAARAAEHLRAIAVELHMAPVRSAVHLAAGDFMAVHPLGADGAMESVGERLVPATAAMFDDLVWWANALKPAREEDVAEAA